jgi:hypothetical protein
LTGILTLDALGDPLAVWVFKVGSTLTTASNSSVRMINGGYPCNVFWQVGSSATLGSGTAFAGNILALASITLVTGARIYGRALATAGAVTMDTNNVSICSPTAVELSSFTATGEWRSIRLDWTTASEVDNLGFNLYRATKIDGPRTQVNEDLIYSLVNPGSSAGAVYAYEDTPMQGSGTYFYWLEDVDLSGNTSLHGPVEVQLSGGPGKGPPVE